MSQVCSQCSHVNPGDASYCYFDGVRLQGSMGGGPVNAGKQGFPIPFVFPSGLVCQNFDQFASACQDNWQAAVSLLKDGLLVSFFGGIGRTDLALAAQEAARFPDLDRGLDQLLAKLPTQTLQTPKLKVEPGEINLGQIGVGSDRTVQLRLANAGMRLIYGTVASDAKWITLGDAPGSPQKIFQFGSETSIPVQIRGQQLRAGTKPIEGQLLIETNCGSITVTVKGMVPITPFKEGVLAGSITPRNIAEKARAKPKDAAVLFEKGVVAQWFKNNGWIYPVQGPAAEGIGSVQQFFEALGLAKAPKVTINPQTLALKGAPGQRAEATLEVTTHEKKPVYAYATCEMPWVDVHKVKLAGNKATITVSVPSIPPRPGETLQTKIVVAGNGNQRFTVPFHMMITGTVARGTPPLATPVAPLANLGAQARPPTAMPATAAFANPSGLHRPPAAAPVVDVRAGVPPLIVAPSLLARPHRTGKPRWLHAVPALGLVVILLVLPFRDWLAPEPHHINIVDPLQLGGIELDDRPKVEIMVDYAADWGKSLPKGVPGIAYNNFNFGLITMDLDKTTIDPKTKQVTAGFKKLLFSMRGHTNNTLVKIDKNTSIFGMPGSGDWAVKPRIGTWPPYKSGGKPGSVADWLQKEAIGTWKVNGVCITQDVKIVPGNPVEIGDTFKRLYDTCRVSYTLENKDAKDHSVGLRVLLDTYIGSHDDVPFNIAGEKDLRLEGDFVKDRVPDFIMALEHADLNKPGTVVQFNLRVGKPLEPPDRVSLTRWPGAGKGDEYNVYDEFREDDKVKLRPNEKKTFEKLAEFLKNNWDVKVQPIDKDSCVVMYWDPETLKSGAKRELGYTYGLSSLATSTVKADEYLRVDAASGNHQQGGQFTISAFVNNPKANDKLTLVLPEGLALLDGERQTQPVPTGGGKRVDWRVISSKLGVQTFEVKSESSSSKKGKVEITIPDIAG